MQPGVDAQNLTRDLFRKHFGYTPAHVVLAPAHLALLGAETQACDGVVIGAAIDRFVGMASSPRTDGKIELVFSAPSKPETFWLTDLKPNPAAPWANPVKAVLAQLRKRGAHFSGFSAAVYSTIPSGLDFGAAAALEVATAATVRQLFPYSLSETGATLPPKRDERGRLPPMTKTERRHLAALCRAASTGQPDAAPDFAAHIPALFGKAWHLLSIDCRAESVEPMPLAGEALIVCDTGLRSFRITPPEETLITAARSVTEQLRLKSLRSLEPRMLNAVKHKLAPDEFNCAYHLVCEIQRAVAAERALLEDDHHQLGCYMFCSYESARESFRTSCAEIDLLIELARGLPGCLGARPINGGATVNLVAYHEAENFMDRIAREYETRTGQKINPFVCQIVDAVN
ncbi:MAG: hypothetical protein N2379_02225 [Verrucomicrobiae bacterium]|nr:hypothetical protein [Verrucomicrobiae bacterium]